MGWARVDSSNMSTHFRRAPMTCSGHPWCPTRWANREQSLEKTDDMDQTPDLTSYAPLEEARSASESQRVPSPLRVRPHFSGGVPNLEHLQLGNRPASSVLRTPRGWHQSGGRHGGGPLGARNTPKPATAGADGLYLEQMKGRDS